MLDCRVSQDQGGTPPGEPTIPDFIDPVNPIGHTTTVPDVVGILKDDALGLLAAVGLEAEVVTQSSDQPKGTVVAQNPAAHSEVQPGSTVRITVAKGVEEQVIPDVVGLSISAAEAQLLELGLVAAPGDFLDCGQEPGTVCDQNPNAGTPFRAGDRVTLTIQK